MKVDFTNLRKDEYEMQLPSPVFSTLEIRKALSPGIIYQDVIKVESDLPLFTHVVADAAFISLAQEIWEGSSLSIPYKLDLRHLKPGDTWSGCVYFTYLGGEKTLPVTVVARDAETRSETSAVDKAFIATESRKKAMRPYSIRQAKRSWHIDEEVSLFIMNHQSYPLTVLVDTSSTNLKADHQLLNVNEMTTLTLKLGQTWFDRFISRKYYRQAPEPQDLTLRVRHEEGEEMVVVPIEFTGYHVADDRGDIKNDRDYGRRILRAQQGYNDYILFGNQTALHKAIKLVGEALSYHSSDTALRLFYVLLLCENHDDDAVRHQVGEIRRFGVGQSDDLDGALDDILVFLDGWLIGDLPDIRAWRVTGFRQLYALRLTAGGHDYDRCQYLYDQGLTSTHLFAHCAADQNRTPIIPKSHSAFYRKLLLWSINHEALGPVWFQALERWLPQVIRYGLINSSAARRLYTLKQGEGALKILLAALINEGVRSQEAYAIYSEGMRHQFHLQGLEEAYFETAANFGMPIVFEDVSVTGLKRKLSENAFTYLLRQYLEDELTDKSAHLQIMRHYRELIRSFRHKVWTEDQSYLIAHELRGLIEGHQWHHLVELYESVDFDQSWLRTLPIYRQLVQEGHRALGFTWLMDKFELIKAIPVMSNEEIADLGHWLLDTRYVNEFKGLWYGGAFTNQPVDTLELWVFKLFEASNSLAMDMADSVFEMGDFTEDFLMLYLEINHRSLRDGISLYETYSKDHTMSENFLRDLIYRGALTRMEPGVLLGIYRYYLDHFSGSDGPLEAYMNNYMAAVVLVDEPYGLSQLVEIFEGYITSSKVDSYGLSPVSLALLRLYQIYGKEEPSISRNIINNAIKNGIMFPWFQGLMTAAKHVGPLRKAAYFSYHTKPGKRVIMFYRYEEESDYRELEFRHVFLGQYIGYVVAFYGERIQYYYVEKDSDGSRRITESGLYVHQHLADPRGHLNVYDTVNTMTVAMEMKDEATVLATLEEQVAYRATIDQEMEMM